MIGILTFLVVLHGLEANALSYKCYYCTSPETCAPNAPSRVQVCREEIDSVCITSKSDGVIVTAGCVVKSRLDILQIPEGKCTKLSGHDELSELIGKVGQVHGHRMMESVNIELCKCSENLCWKIGKQPMKKEQRSGGDREYGGGFGGHFGEGFGGQYGGGIGEGFNDHGYGNGFVEEHGGQYGEGFGQGFGFENENQGGMILRGRHKRNGGPKKLISLSLRSLFGLVILSRNIGSI